MAVTFNTLNANAKIFTELNNKPSWWKQFVEDPSFYIEVRKDNQVNVYFEGGSIARIHYCSKRKRLQVFTHHKYLDIKDTKPMYVECSDFIGNTLEDVIVSIKQCYSQKHSSQGVTSKEAWSEKFIQGRLIVKNRDIHLDSEFAYKENDTDIRIDMVNVINGKLTFVELKRIDDNRMLKKTDAPPEVVYQMKDYSDFISRHKDSLLAYYQRLYEIKKSLGLPIPSSFPKEVNPTPELLIFNRWVKQHPFRVNHKIRMEEILQREGITYNIIDEI